MNKLKLITKTLISVVQKPFSLAAGFIKSEYIKHKYDIKYTEEFAALFEIDEKSYKNKILRQQFLNQERFNFIKTYKLDDGNSKIYYRFFKSWEEESLDKIFLELTGIRYLNKELAEN